MSLVPGAWYFVLGAWFFVLEHAFAIRDRKMHDLPKTKDQNQSPKLKELSNNARNHRPN